MKSELLYLNAAISNPEITGDPATRAFRELRAGVPGRPGWQIAGFRDVLIHDCYVPDLLAPIQSFLRDNGDVA